MTFQDISKQHAQNVARHLEVSEGLIYIPGQHEIFIEDSDFTYPFRQQRGFYYLSGADEANFYMTYDIGNDETVLYVPHISVKDAIWYGRGSNIEEAKERYDFDDIRWTSSLPSDLESHVLQHPCQKIYVLHPSQIPLDIPCTNPAPIYDTSSLLPALNASRCIKDEHEIATIRHAIDISSFAHAAILHHITAMHSEAEVKGRFLDVCISNGAPLQAYDPIVASGTNASILHYSNDNEDLKGRNLLCLDSGCEYKCYASDITRTFPLSAGGWASKEAKDLYDLVSLIQQSCIALLWPGQRFADVFLLAQKMTVSGLIRLGVLKIEDSEETIHEFIANGGVYAFFPHGLGHHIGLDVHDLGPIDRQVSSVSRGPYAKPWTRTIDLRAPCTTDSVLLQPGMFISVEPGIYFNRYALDHLYLKYPEFAVMVDLEVLKRYITVGGVRIEDDILITRQGFVNMTKAPKGDDMLRIIREGAKCDHGAGCEYRKRMKQESM